MYFGRDWMGTRKETSRNAPGGTPAPPIPEMTLPMIKTPEVGAAAHTIEPISKMAMLMIMTHLTE